MNTLIKQTRVPSLRSMMEDFWNTDFSLERLLRSGDSLPAVNVKETDSHFDIEVAAPGFKKEDFKIDITKRMLTISAENKNEHTEDKDNYTRKEFSYSSFSRSFSLPETVNESDIKARYENGLLHLILQKSEKSEPQKRTISVD